MFEDYGKKVRHILPVFIYIVLGTALVSLGFRWLFTIKYQAFELKEDLLDFWIPFLLPWIPIFIWFRPRIRVLKFYSNSDIGMFYQFLAWGGAIAVILVSHSYLKTASGQLLKIKDISEFKGDVRYLEIDTVKIVSKIKSVHLESNTSGRYNEHLNLKLYFVTPFKESENSGKYKYWYGVKYQKQISNRLSDLEKEMRYNQFFNTSLKNFDSYQFSKPKYYEVLAHSNDKEGYLESIKEKNNFAASNPIIIEPKEGLYKDRNGYKFAWIFGAFGLGTLAIMIALIFPKFNKNEYLGQKKGKKPQSNDLKEFLIYLIPKGDHFVTSLILDLNILMFLIMVFSGVSPMHPKATDLLKWGAVRDTEVYNGEWWRLLTSMFLHGGIMHLLLNIYGFIIAAMYIEPVFNKINYLLLYIGSGLCASFASIYWNDHIVSVGASGAIFGLYGAILGLLLTKVFPKIERKMILNFLGPYILISLIFGLIGGIDNAAHIGGLLGGTVIGLSLNFIAKWGKRGKIRE